MDIVLNEIERSTLSAFAEKHGLVMEINERESKFFPVGSGRHYYAHFQKCEVKEEHILCGTSGDGDTPDEAMKNYAVHISGCKLVFNAYRDDRKEIDAPIFTGV